MEEETKSEQLGVDDTSFMEDIGRKRWSDLARTFGLIATGLVLFYGSTPFAKWIGESSLSYIGYIAGMLALLVGLSHPFRRMLFPYIDMRRVAAQAVKSPIGAGIVWLGMCFVIGCLILASVSVKAETIPPGAIAYAPILKEEAKKFWPEYTNLHYLAGQTEQESCVSLKSPRCWNPRAELKVGTPGSGERYEWGVGFGQITQTNTFDALKEMRLAHPTELGEWAWNKPSLYDPKLQFRGLVLKNKDNYTRIIGTNSELDHQAMMFVAYNGGLGRVISDRKMCQATKGCDPSKWFGNVENTTRLPKVALKGYGKSFFQINREYPVNILRVRSEKYKGLMGVKS